MTTEIALVASIQAAVLFVTLGVLIWQTWLSRLRLEQEVELQCERDYTSLVRLLIEKPELQKIYADLYGDEWTRYSPDERDIYNYFELMYELFDRVFWLYEQKWMDLDTWSHWEKSLTQIARHPLFVDFHNDTRGEFPSSYQEHVDKIIAEVQAK
jgi:hypothetical protein